MSLLTTGAYRDAFSRYRGTWKLYVLLCEGAYFYVGISKDLRRRLQQHLRREGATFTRWHHPVSVHLVLDLHTDCEPVAQAWEDSITAQYASLYGVWNVSGGRYCWDREGLWAVVRGQRKHKSRFMPHPQVWAAPCTVD